jgi:L-serine dehydratase
MAMETIKDIFRIGIGPSSSHTMGPRIVAIQFLKDFPDTKAFRVTLYGALSATGKGHLTDTAIIDALAIDGKSCEIIWSKETLSQHPNGMKFEALDKNQKTLASQTWFSTGGGAVIREGVEKTPTQIYNLNTMDEIRAWSQKEGLPIWKYVELCEGPDIWEYLKQVWKTMKRAIKAGISDEGILPGCLKLERRGRAFFLKSKWCADHLKRTGLLAGYALAVSEQNAAGGTIVTAPTCGACGVLPAVMYYLHKTLKSTEKEILHALAIAGIIGNITKKNATISGAEAGCQAEVGTACAMAAAAAAQLMGGTNQQIECAAEMGMEHHLGLTCDPIAGLVQIPCIERNSIAATRAMDCADIALLSAGEHRISYDEVVQTMYQTGKDMNSSYRETSLGGLATLTRESRESQNN